MKFLILFICVVSVFAGPGKKEDKQNGREKSDQKAASNEADENPICDKNLPVNTTVCCPNIPSLSQFFDSCKTSCNITDGSSSSPDKKEGRKGDRKNFQFNPQMACLFKCVRDSAGIADSTGNVSTDLLSQKLLENADSVWSSFVPDAVTGCFNNITTMFANKTCNKPEGKGGKGRDGKKSGSNSPPNFSFADMTTGMLLACIDKALYLNCPSTVNSTDCSDLTTKLTVCKCEHEEGGERGHDENNEQENNKQGGRGKEQKDGRNGKRGENRNENNNQKEQQQRQQKGKTEGKGKNQQQKSKSPQAAQ